MGRAAVFPVIMTMAYVSVPKDLQRIKSKLVLNLTARQVFCFAIAAVTGLPFYFLTKNVIGTGNAGAGMVLLMLPAFLFARYEKDGLPLDRVLLNMINVRLRRPAVRRYEVHNLYDMPCGGTAAAQGKGGTVAGKKKKE